MSAGTAAVFFFCLGTGAALGCLFLLLKAVRLLLRLGKAGTALLDLVFCCLCGGAVFLCALAVDKGRLRAFQAGLQLVGGWAAVTALDPLASGSAKGIRKIFCKVFAVFRKPWAFLKAKLRKGKRPEKKKAEKTGKKRKKVQKRT